MTALRTIRRSESPALRGVVALLCVLLVLFVGAAQVLHMHAPNEAANPGCSLCAVAHVAAVAAPMAVPPVFAAVAHVVDAAERTAPPYRYFPFALYVRPPPAWTTHA